MKEAFHRVPLFNKAKWEIVQSILKKKKNTGSIKQNTLLKFL